jgi:hypothetical protein
MELAGYLDGALRGRRHVALSRHLDRCAACRDELQRYRQLQSLMSGSERVAPPAGLAFRIRMAVSRERSRPPLRLRLRDRAALIIENMLEPVAVPATGGLMMTLGVFAVVLQSLFVGVPLGAVPNDVPTNINQPARLEFLAPFTITSDEPLDEYGTSAVMVEAVISARGDAIGYEILSGPKSPSVRRQLDQVLMFSRFRPATSFGRPVPGGRVVLNLTEVRVKG